MSRRNALCAATLSAVSLIAALPAAAQVAGTYAGTAADGSSETFTGTDDGSGNLSVTSAFLYYSATCTNGGGTAGGGIGYGLNTPITAGRARIVTSFPYFYTSVELAFYKNGQSGKGAIAVVVPQLVSDGGLPKRVDVCTSPKQPMTFALQTGADAARAARAPAGTYLYDRRGRIIGTVSR